MTLWYLARGAGLAALVLLTLTTALGAITTGRRSAGERVLLQYAHRATASLGLGALALHLVAILGDSFAHVGWLASLVPFTSQFRPLWVGLGTLAVYTFVGVAALGVARVRIASSPLGARVWRGLHGLSYVGWALAMLHGINAGSDTSAGWVRVVYAGCAAAVVGAVAGRLAVGSRRVTAVAR